MTQATAFARRTNEDHEQTPTRRPDAFDTLRVTAGLEHRPGRATRGDAPVIRLSSSAEPAGANAAPTDQDQSFGADLKLLIWRAVDRTDLRYLAHLLARYPTLANGIFLPTLIVTVLFFLISDIVALVLGVFAIANGVVFAMTAAKQMARDGFDFSTSSTQET